MRHLHTNCYFTFCYFVLRDKVSNYIQVLKFHRYTKIAHSHSINYRSIMFSYLFQSVPSLPPRGPTVDNITTL